MKQEKLYLNVNIIQKGTYKQTHQLIRVDNIKEFWPIIYDKKCSIYFNSLKGLNMIEQVKNPEPFRAIMPSEIFDLLVSKVNSKIGSIFKLNTDFLRIVQSSNHKPCIVIERDMDNKETIV